MNNRAGRPFEEKTITAYSDPVKSLDRWMTANGIDGDFTVVDTALLNRCFREYCLEHGQGGTHTQQRNLIQLFSFLERERGFATPCADGLNRYAPGSRIGARAYTPRPSRPWAAVHLRPRFGACG